MVSTLPQLEQRVNLSGITWETYQRIKFTAGNGDGLFGAGGRV